MAWVATAIVGAGALGAGASIYGANKGANAQTNASNQAISAQRGMFDVTQQNLQPFIQGGASAIPQQQDILKTLQQLTTPGASMTETLNQLPGFKFAQDWGQKAIQNLGTTRGLGGNVLTAGADYATGKAQQGWGSLVSALQGTAGSVQGLINSGANAAGGLATNATATGGQIGGNLVGIGNAQAGAATATGSAIGGLGNSISTAAILRQLGLGGGGMYGANTSIPNNGSGIYTGDPTIPGFV